MTKKSRLALLFLADVVLIGTGLLLYAYFHHARPVIYPPTGYGNVNVDASSLPDWSEKFPDKFLHDDTVIQDANGYQSKNIHLTLTKVQKENLCYYLADIYLRNITYLKTAFAEDSYSRGLTQYVADMAKDNNAILATSGDYYGVRDRGRVIRNGVVYRTTRCYQVCALYYDGTMETYRASEFDPEKAVAGGVYQTWDFGPALLDKSGKAITDFDSGIAGQNPRCAIGYFEPGHYVLAVVDGRQEGYSMGMTLAELAQLFEDLGCVRAYNLDGGQSANMAYRGELCNIPTRGGRKISDIIFLKDDVSGGEA